MNTESSSIHHFNPLASQWWDPKGPMKTLHHINPVRLSYIQSFVSLKNASCIDIGCGAGLLTEALAQEGAQPIGCDLAPDLIKVAQQHAHETNLSITYECTDIVSYAQQHPQSAQVITCMELLEHVPDPREIVQSCADLCAPGGWVFFSTIDRTPKAFALAIVAAEYLMRLVPRGTHQYLELIRPSELIGWLQEAGLELVDLRGLHYNPLTARASLGPHRGVNYLMATRKPT